MHARRTRVLIAVVGLLSVLLAGGFPLVKAQTVRHVTFNAGDVIPVRLDTELSSLHSRVGDRFTARVDSSHRGYEFLAGATVEGRVTRAVRRQGDEPGVLGLSFSRLKTRGGRSYDISGSLASLESGAVDQRPNGMLVARSSERNRTLEFAGIGAGGAALVGLLGNGRLNLGSALLGGALGAGVGQLTRRRSEQDVTLGAGTRLGVRIDRGFEFRG